MSASVMFKGMTLTTFLTHAARCADHEFQVRKTASKAELKGSFLREIMDRVIQITDEYDETYLVVFDIKSAESYTPWTTTIHVELQTLPKQEHIKKWGTFVLDVKNAQSLLHPREGGLDKSSEV